MIVKEVTAIGSQQREAMGVDIVDMAFSLASYTAFKLGDFVSVYNQLYKLNTIPEEQKISNRNYSFNLKFQAIWYDLAKVQMQMLNPQNQLLEPVFDITGNAATILGLIVDNANRYSAGWTVGVVDDTPYETFSYNGHNCLQALHEMASKFDTEFWIDNQTIHFQKREYPSGVTFEYGKGNGLYTVSRKAKEGASLLTRLYVRGGSTNLPTGYGSNSLLLPNGETYIQDDDKVNPALGGELIEATKVFPEIFPTRTGTVSSVVAGDDNWKYFFDASLDFDINEHKAAGLEPKVHFISGDLAGYTFTISDYDHATKRFTINKNDEETALEIPSNVLRPKVGDKYRLIDLLLPQPYVTDAENRLLAAAWEYYNQNSEVANLTEYSASVDRMFIKANNIDVVLGNTAILHDEEMGFTTELRIAKYTRNLQDEFDYSEVVWKDRISSNEIVRQYQQQQKTIQLLESSGLLSVEQMRKSLFLNRLSERNGYLMLGANKVKAGIADYTPEAGHAMIANEAVNADLWDGKQLADYLNQPVRDTDDVTFKSVKGKSFVSGAFGNGFRIDENGNAEFDSLVIRKSFQATEFILQKVRASNGAIAVTDSCVVKSVNNLGVNLYKCTIETDGGNIAPTFLVDDLVRCQVFDGASFKYIFARVTDVGDDYFTLYLENATIAPVAGDTFVRVGSLSNANRQGLIYMSNADSGAPFIDVLDGVNSETLAGKTKVRLGKLDGIVDPDLGALAGYGIYAQNGYFKGKVIVTGGNAQTIAGSQALANVAQANAISAAANDATAKASAAEANAQAMVNALKVGGRNLLTDSKNKTYTAVWRYITGLADGEQITVQLWGAGSVACYFDNGFQYAQTLNTVNGYGALTYTVMPHSTNPNNNGTVLLIFSVTATDIKVEKGNKATDWTPANEDVEAAVGAAQSTATAAQNANAALAASLKAMAFQDVVELSKLGTTVIEGGKIKTTLLDADFIKASVINTAYINSLEIDAGAIKSGTIDSARINASQIVVAGGGATQAYAQSLVESVKIGGRNLVRKNYIVNYYGGSNWVDNDFVTNGSNAIALRYDGYSPAIMGETYTVSGYCLVDGQPALRGSFWRNDDYTNDFQESIKLTVDNATGYFQAIYKVVDVGDWGSRHFLIFTHPVNQSGKTITFKNLKVEKGNKATDWTPAPEDVDTAVSAANAAAIAAQNANSALIASLKAMAYKDVVELAELGTTIIQGGKIKTNLLDADYIKSSIINTAYLNSLEIVTKNLKTAATGKRVEIDSVENNIRFFNDAGDEIMSIDDDSVLERIVHDNTQVPPVDYYYYGPGFRAGARNGKSGNLSRNGLTVWGDDGKLKFKVGDRNGLNDYRITATGIEPDPTSYYYGEDITFTALNGVFDLRKADGGTVKVTFIDGLLMRIGNPDVLAYWNNITGSATVQYAPCSAGEVGTSHTRTVAVGTVKGTSQADANNKANAQALALAQADAANNGYCRTQIYRIIFSNNYDNISYSIKDIDGNQVSIPVNITVSYYISSPNGARNENATIYGGNSFGTLVLEGAAIYDFIVNGTTPNQHNDIPIWTEMQ